MEPCDPMELLKRVFLYYQQQFPDEMSPNLLPLLGTVRGSANKQKRYNLYRSLAKACGFSARTPYPKYISEVIRLVYPDDEYVGFIPPPEGWTAEDDQMVRELEEQTLAWVYSRLPEVPDDNNNS
eukprot:4320420-Pyramimonas_sp.AAC.2